MPATSIDLPSAPPIDAPFPDAAAQLADTAKAHAAAARRLRHAMDDFEFFVDGYALDINPAAFLAASWNTPIGVRDAAPQPPELGSLLDMHGVWRDRRAWRDTSAQSVLIPGYLDAVLWADEPRDDYADYSDPVTGFNVAAFNARRDVAVSKRAAARWAGLRDALRPIATDHWTRLQPLLDAQLKRSRARITDALTVKPPQVPVTKGRPKWR